MRLNYESYAAVAVWEGNPFLDCVINNWTLIVKVEIPVGDRQTGPLWEVFC